MAWKAWGCVSCHMDLQESTPPSTRHHHHHHPRRCFCAAVRVAIAALALLPLPPRRALFASATHTLRPHPWSRPAPWPRRALDTAQRLGLPQRTWRGLSSRWTLVPPVTMWLTPWSTNLQPASAARRSTQQHSRARTGHGSECTRERGSVGRHTPTPRCQHTHPRRHPRRRLLCATGAAPPPRCSLPRPLPRPPRPARSAHQAMHWPHPRPRQADAPRGVQGGNGPVEGHFVGVCWADVVEDDVPAAVHVCVGGAAALVLALEHEAVGHLERALEHAVAVHLAADGGVRTAVARGVCKPAEATCGATAGPARGGTCWGCRMWLCTRCCCCTVAQQQGTSLVAARTQPPRGSTARRAHLRCRGPHVPSPPPPPPPRGRAASWRRRPSPLLLRTCTPPLPTRRVGLRATRCSVGGSPLALPGVRELVLSNELRSHCNCANRAA